jgi:fructose-1,6-bisphosphatase/inositol monophosphatase family enzyme
VLELKSGRRFVARRGGGVEADDPLSPSANEELSRLFWAAGYRGRPADDLTAVLGPLIDRSSVGGGYFDPGSAAYILTRVATGQLDAYVDVGPRIVAEIPGAEARFRALGGGEILCNRPYDLAAALLVLRELGLPATDAWGRPLEDAPLRGGIVSCLAAANGPLHAGLLGALDGRFGELAATPSGASGRLSA